MIHFFKNQAETIYAVQAAEGLSAESVEKLLWLFGQAEHLGSDTLQGTFVGPRAAMITPWSTNAVEITQNMAIEGIVRIEEFAEVAADFTGFDPMLHQRYNSLTQDIFTIAITPEPVRQITDIAAYNTEEGLSLSTEEVQYLERLSAKLGRPLTDSEVFGFSQINSEHCRHKIFTGTFVIDGKEQPLSLFKLIKKTSEAHPNRLVSAYKDNVAFIKGPAVVQFAPERGDVPSPFTEKPFESVISLKAETHNFPTTVEPFNGAATGSGGEIRDRLAGGQGSLPLAGTAVYMTAYSRLEEGRPWEGAMAERAWLYQTPMDILIKASNGATDFGNKFGQPLIAGSLFTFEYEEKATEGGRKLGYDKAIMLAGGVGYGKESQALKHTPKAGDKIVVLGGDNYRIGMGGAAVSSADTGAFGSGIELNAVQRSNPEMQKRAANAIRAFVEADTNPIVSIHDHGAGGHLNCLSELIEETGGRIDLDALPVGDPTLSDKELIGNESQERMGLIVPEEALPQLRAVAERERAPMYVVGEVTDDKHFAIVSEKQGTRPLDLDLSDMFGSSPKTIMEDQSVARTYEEFHYFEGNILRYVEQVLQLEAVASKDWLTNKVDRCVGGRVAQQQCVGPLQLPLSDVGVMTLDFKGKEGIATAIGHSPLTALINPAVGSRNAVAEALTNTLWAPIAGGLSGVSLSANWMWPCRNTGEDARLYKAVAACSDFAIALGINIPTGKDSLSMKQKYKDAEVLAPGTVIISSVGHCTDIKQVVQPVLKRGGGSIYYVNLSCDAYQLGGSALAQVLSSIGTTAPDVKDAAYFKKAFDVIQALIKERKIVAGHDISSGGLITTLLEMCFADNDLGATVDLTALGEEDTVKVLFAENAGVVFQADSSVESYLAAQGVKAVKIGEVKGAGVLHVKNGEAALHFDIAELRDLWMLTSYLLDKQQTQRDKATERYQNYTEQPLVYAFPSHFTGKRPARPTKRPVAAVLREKGSNSEREMANALYLAGFEVRDVCMTDLISGRETLEEVQFLGAVGGFSNSDVLGSAKGWAGAFRYNDKAKRALENFFKREDTLSVGICNGCQLFMELEVINPEHAEHGKMHHNDSGKHESGFVSVVIPENNSVMLQSLAGTRLGVWISHGEGKFHLPLPESDYNIVAKYAYEGYPANPNGSDYNAAMLADKSGRHLVTMPHIERSAFPWNWAYYEEGRTDEVSPWVEAFVNAREWLTEKV